MIVSDTTTPTETTETPYDQDAFDELNQRDRRILTSLGVYGYTPGEDGGMLSASDYARVLARANRRGLDLDLIPEYESTAGVLSAMSSVGGMGRQSRYRGLLTEQISTVELERQQTLRDEALGLAKDALSTFTDDNEYESLIDNIRNLPATLDEDDIRLLRRVNVQKARANETARLRKLRAVSGMRGMGGGSVAAAAERAAAEADMQISAAFNQIAIEQLSLERKDTLEQTTMESEIMMRRQNALLQLQQNYHNVLSGNFVDVTQPMQSFSAFLEARRAAVEAADQARSTRRTSMVNAWIAATASDLDESQGGSGGSVGTGGSSGGGGDSSGGGGGGE